jgi:hypothetical protein
MVTWWVCQLLYIIIFVPYNLFKLFLVHKISVYKYIYVKMGKRIGKRKKKKNSQLAGRGGFRPSERGRGQAAQPAHGGAARHGRTPWAWAHASARGGGNGVERAMEGGRTGRLDRR